MDELKIGFISPGPATWPHYESFKPLVPRFVNFDFQGLGLYRDALYDIAGKKDEIVHRIAQLVDRKKWHALIVIGAPTEVMNPGLLVSLKSVLQIPITTALSASMDALRCYKAHRLLLLTPFEERLNRMIDEHLSAAGFNVIAPRPFDTLAEAGSQTPEAVYQLTAKALAECKAVDAVYFQGAVLDPLKVLDQIEENLNTIAIASNPAMLWSILSQLGHRQPIAGYGKLLAQWPGLR